MVTNNYPNTCIKISIFYEMFPFCVKAGILYGRWRQQMVLLDDITTQYYTTLGGWRQQTILSDDITTQCYTTLGGWRQQMIFSL